MPPEMNNKNTNAAVVFITLVLLGVVVRVLFQHIPNFAPVAALAIFAGYVLGNRMLALATPLMIMLISDRLIDSGGYELPLMLTVYAFLAVPAIVAGPLRKFFSFGHRGLGRSVAVVAGLVGCSVTCSLLFFFGTNFMVWATSSWYEPTLAGLAKCYLNAIPFLRYTVAGDVIFSTALFGGYAVWAWRNNVLTRPAVQLG